MTTASRNLDLSELTALSDSRGAAVDWLAALAAELFHMGDQRGVAHPGWDVNITVTWAEKDAS